jgi:hypothetical protein
MSLQEPGIAGTMLYHCHILEHEDKGMMAKIQLLWGGTASTKLQGPK